MSKSELLKKLRDLTQAGFMDCKKALEAVEYDLDAAVKWLREKGIAKAASKNAEKVSAEGTTWAAKDENGAALIELNAQTDFTGQSSAVLELAKEIVHLVLKAKTSDLKTILETKLDSGTTVNEACLELSFKTGEKIVLRRVLYLPVKPDQTVIVYRHDNGKISSLVLFKNKVDEEKARGVVLHLTAMNPKFLDQSQVDQEWLASERQILEKQLEAEGKPAQFAQKIIDGRINKLLSEVCLTSQEYILNPDQKVGDYLKSLPAEIVEMKRFELGEGIEVVKVDFAAEVEAQMKKA